MLALTLLASSVRATPSMGAENEPGGDGEKADRKEDQGAHRVERRVGERPAMLVVTKSTSWCVDPAV